MMTKHEIIKASKQYFEEKFGNIEFAPGEIAAQQTSLSDGGQLGMLKPQ